MEIDGKEEKKEQDQMQIDNEGTKKKNRASGKNKKKGSKSTPKNRQKKDPEREYKYGPFRTIVYDFKKKQADVLFRMNLFPKQLIISPKGDYLAVNPGLRYFYLYDTAAKTCQR